MKKRKIAFIINSLSSGGAERVITTLANNFTGTFEIYIITFINTPPFYDLDKSVKVIPCFNEIKPSSNPIKAIWSNYVLFKRINFIIKDNNFDLLISFMTTANVLTSIIKIINNIPVIISERNNPVKQNLSAPWKILRRITYRYADYVVVQTSTIKDFFVGKIADKCLLVLPNPISPRLSKLRDVTYLKENIILSVGRLTTQKAQHILIESFALLKNKKWKLIIVGEGPDRIKLENLIKQLDLSEYAFLVGQQKDIHNYYNKAKIFAFSSLYEGFPNALIEAMHFGLACVSTNCPTGPSKLIENGVNGYLVPLNDIRAMTNKLKELMMDQSKINEFGEKSVVSVKQYEEENVVAQWETIIKSLIV